jgi:hypothetical protein
MELWQTHADRRLSIWQHRWTVLSLEEWLARFAETERSDMVDLGDDALAAYAKTKGFDAPPKR